MKTYRIAVIEAVLTERTALTPDQGGAAGTAACGDAVCEALRRER